MNNDGQNSCGVFMNKWGDGLYCRSPAIQGNSEGIPTFIVHCSFYIVHYTQRPRPLRDAALLSARYHPAWRNSRPPYRAYSMRACCNGQPRAGLLKRKSSFSPPLLGDTAARRPAALAPVAARFEGVMDAACPNPGFTHAIIPSGRAFVKRGGGVFARIPPKSAGISGSGRLLSAGCMHTGTLYGHQ